MMDREGTGARAEAMHDDMVARANGANVVRCLWAVGWIVTSPSIYLTSPPVPSLTPSWLSHALAPTADARSNITPWTTNAATLLPRGSPLVARGLSADPAERPRGRNEEGLQRAAADLDAATMGPPRRRWTLPTRGGPTCARRRTTSGSTVSPRASRVAMTAAALATLAMRTTATWFAQHHSAMCWAVLLRQSTATRGAAGATADRAF